MELSGKQPLIIAVSIVLIILSTVSVVLRFFSRHMMGNKLWWDDWCAVVAMVCKSPEGEKNIAFALILTYLASVVFSEYCPVCQLVPFFFHIFL